MVILSTSTSSLQHPDDLPGIELTTVDGATPDVQTGQGTGVASLPDSQAASPVDVCVLNTETLAEALPLIPQIIQQRQGIPLVILTDESCDADALRAALQHGAQSDHNNTQLSPETLLDVATVNDRYARSGTDRALQAERDTYESNFHTIVRSNVDSLLIIDDQGVIVFANPAAEALFKRPHHELVGSLFGFPVVGADSTELSIFRGQEGKVIAEMRVAGIQWQGQPAYLASLRDITERKRMEQTLNHSRQLYRTLASNLPNTSVLMFNEELCCLVAEGQFFQVQGRTSDMLENKFLVEILPSDQRDSIMPFCQAALQGESSAFEMEIDQQSYYVRTLPVSDGEQGIFAGLLVIQDVTDYEEAPIRATRAEQRARELSSLKRYASPAIPNHPRDADITTVLSANPETYSEVCALYEHVLDFALEQRMYKTGHDVSPDLRTVAERLGQMNAGPRDVVELHLNVLKERATRQTRSK